MLSLWLSCNLPPARAFSSVPFVLTAVVSATCRQLLAFVTGSDRVPIDGLGALHPSFVIHKNGDARFVVLQVCVFGIN